MGTGLGIVRRPTVTDPVKVQGLTDRGYISVSKLSGKDRLRSLIRPCLSSPAVARGPSLVDRLLHNLFAACHCSKPTPTPRL